MASFRRTLSPSHHHSHYPSSTKHLQLLPVAVHSLRGPVSWWRRAAYRCILSSLIGFLLGIIMTITSTPHVRHDFRSRDFITSDDTNPMNTTAAADHLREERINIPPPPENDTVVVSAVSLVETRNHDNEERKLLIVVTPTYARVFQAYYLHRLGQVLRLVRPPVLWIVVEKEGGGVQDAGTAEVLRGMGVMYRHLVVCGKGKNDGTEEEEDRNVALRHIEEHKLDGIVYFADDDDDGNVVSVELFERIRGISRFGTWPVAMLAQGKSKTILEGPVCNGSQVIGWHTNEKSKRLRRFHVDMSGLAFNSTILWDPKRYRRPVMDPIRQLDTVKEGFQETTFIEQLVEDESQMEGIPHGCGRIMNWHLHLEAHGVNYPRGWSLQNTLDTILPLF